MKLKVFAIAVLIAVILAASFFAVYFTEASVNYSQGTSYLYQKQGDSWVTLDYNNNKLFNGSYLTVYCQNRGYFDSASFNLIVTLTNATFSPNSFTAKIAYSLHDKEVHSTDLQFFINSNATGFGILIALQPNSIFMRSTEGNWLGQNPIFYENSANNTLAPVLFS